MYRTLVIGEGPEECQALSNRLGALGYDSRSAPFDPVLALRSVFAVKPDAVIFDADADNGARRVFRMLADVSQLPIVVVGSALGEDDLVWYLEGGAASYIQKPTSPSVIAAHVKNLIMRTEAVANPAVAVCGNVTIDIGRREVRKNGAVVSLTPTEFRLLEVLLDNADRSCGKKMLLSRVWGEAFDSCTHYLSLYMGYLRTKLEDNPRKPTLFLTEWGHGYRMVTAERAGRGFALAPRGLEAQA